MAFLIFLAVAYITGIPVAWWIRRKLHSMTNMRGDLKAYVLFSWTYVIPGIMTYLTIKHKKV